MKLNKINENYLNDKIFYVSQIILIIISFPLIYLYMKIELDIKSPSLFLFIYLLIIGIFTLKKQKILSITLFTLILFGYCIFIINYNNYNLFLVMIFPIFLSSLYNTNIWYSFILVFALNTSYYLLILFNREVAKYFFTIDNNYIIKMIYYIN